MKFLALIAMILPASAAIGQLSPAPEAAADGSSHNCSMKINNCAASPLAKFIFDT